MTQTDKQWFAELTAKRKNAVDVLQEEGLINVFVSHIVDTYRESAHFIFELLQNADDVKATNVRFELSNVGLVFAHNGLVNFSISDPAVERTPGIVPGHINAITTFSLSPKKEDIENKIGKFGIGFKSVFQYTDTPHIYNPPFHFKIENFMIPKEVEFKKDILKEGETTAFWLPFDKEDKPSNEAYNEILVKLNELRNPLLFLRNLVAIEVKSGTAVKTFSKKITKIKTVGLDSIEICQVKLDADTILRFDKKVNIIDKDKVAHNLSINVGFVLNDKNIVASENYKNYFQYAWCYFPTKQPTSLNYILNAPFILTPNREALKEGRTENNQLFDALGTLFESAIQGLKMLGYITEDFFVTISDPINLPQEFKSVGEKIISKLKNGEFIPTEDGKYIPVSDAYVCTEAEVAELMKYDNNSLLKKITGKLNARIIVPSKNLTKNQSQFIFFYKNLSAEKSDLNNTWLGGKIQSNFLQGMPQDFIIKFFRFLVQKSNSILGKNQPLWAKQFIPVSKANGFTEFVSPNNRQGEPQVFIEGAKVAGRFVIAEYLANIPEIRSFLIGVLRFRTPNEFDDFYASLTKYENKENTVVFEDAIKDFFLAFKYSKEASQLEVQKLIKRIKELDFIITSAKEEGYTYINPSKFVTYLPSKELETYFKNYALIIRWVAVDKYFAKEIINDDIKFFLEQLNVRSIPFHWPINSDGKKNVLHGIEVFIKDISLDSSIYLIDILNKINAVYIDGLTFLKGAVWLYDVDGVKRKPTEIHAGKLHNKYPLYANMIHIALGAIIEIETVDRYSGLNDEEKGLLAAIMPSLNDLTTDEIKNAIAELLEKKKKENSKNKTEASFPDDTTPSGLLEIWGQGVKPEKPSPENHIPTIPNSADFWNDNSFESSDNDNPGGFLSAPIVGTKYKGDTENKKKQQIEKEVEREAKRNKLIELANQFEPYSFGWFKTLLELEDSFTSEDRVKRNPVRVVFGKAELDTDGLLILSDTVYIPPTIEEIGELSIQLFFGDDKKTIKGEVVSPKKQILVIKLSSHDQLKGVDLTNISQAVVEASSPDFILEKLKIAFARLNFKDTDNLKNPDILTKDLNFVFGPPGTGKTTYLSWLIGGKNPEPIKFSGNLIQPFMEQTEKKILVLTPTNKAADIIVQRIIKNYEDVLDYPQWLIRFGQSEVLNQEPVFVGDRILKPWVYEKCTLVTTIARFPYDYFKVEQKDQESDDWFIKDFNWDVIIFDEASMIHQAALLYVVFYAKQVNSNVQFYIGGDPFQIPPIIQFEFPYWSYLPEPAFDNEENPILDETGEQMAWKQDGGNIYSFIGLTKDDSFTKPQTEPHTFLVHHLTKQFRSVESIGALFSHYRYGGKLEHYRTPDMISKNSDLASFEIEIPKLPLKPLTIIKFPVKRYEGVYRVRAIKGSPYQLYSSIFTVELVKYILENAQLNEGDIYRIGVISPYAIQSNIIAKLLSTASNIRIEIVVGTVHSFQGDECNLVIVVLNPPRNISRSVRTFLNKKNILNVAISRARDKMIILTPYDPDNELNIDDLHQIRWIVRLAGIKPECKNNVIGYEASEIEDKLWGSNKFIEESTLHSAHQNVNVYRKAVKHYEVRHDENAIDIQVKSDKIN